MVPFPGRISPVVALIWRAQTVALCGDELCPLRCTSLTNLLSVHLFRWIPFAMLSARQEDTVTDSLPVRCTVRRASV